MEDLAPVEASSTVCANIGPRERALRVRFGVVGWAITLLAAGGMVELHAAWWARLLIALPAFLGAIGVFQATAQTCVAFARQGIMVLGPDRSSARKVEDAQMKAQIARQARRVYLQSALATLGVVAVVLAIP